MGMSHEKVAAIAEKYGLRLVHEDKLYKRAKTFNHIGSGGWIRTNDMGSTKGMNPPQCSCDIKIELVVRMCQSYLESKHKVYSDE